MGKLCLLKKSIIMSPLSAQPSSGSLIKRIRIRKQDSAFVYAIFEGLEGVIYHSTLDPDTGTIGGQGFSGRRQGLHYRDIELRFTPDHEKEVLSVLENLRKPHEFRGQAFPGVELVELSLPA